MRDQTLTGYIADTIQHIADHGKAVFFGRHLGHQVEPADDLAELALKAQVVIGYTPRGADRHVFSMRKANEREKSRIAPLLDV